MHKKNTEEINKNTDFQKSGQSRSFFIEVSSLLNAHVKIINNTKFHFIQYVILRKHIVWLQLKTRLIVLLGIYTIQ